MKPSLILDSGSLKYKKKIQTLAKIPKWPKNGQNVHNNNISKSTLRRVQPSGNVEALHIVIHVCDFMDDGFGVVNYVRRRVANGHTERATEGNLHSNEGKWSIEK